MKFEHVGDLEQLVWQMRLADLPRGENRAILQRLYNGDPPFDPNKAEENNNQINRNFLEGVNQLTKGRSQWNNAMLKQANYFGVTLDSGPISSRQDNSHKITRNINRQLKKCRKQMEQVRGEGANVLLHGIAPSGFSDRRNPVPKLLPVSSLMIPSETDVDFDNLEYFAIFREWTPANFFQMTHGPKVDPGWNMKLVQSQWEYIKDQVQKEPNSSAYQYMPERIEELVKQDMGMWGTDAVPTVDVWDCYFRAAEDGNGWYRRVFLDWNVTGEEVKSWGNGTKPPESRNDHSKAAEKGGFLYSSGNRKFANSLSEILQCQFGDCSAVAPFKYHSVRSLGWMLWGICDLQNLLQCRFSESVFEQLMWFFRTSSQGEFQRIKKAILTHMGVIPQGINFVSANERFKPDAALIELAIKNNRQNMSENSAPFTSDLGDMGNEESATGTMAKVHTMNALTGGIMTLAYEYAKYKYIEQCRRFCIKNSPYKMVRDFRLACLKDNVPVEMLNSERWNVEPDKALGDGNKILEMSIIQFMQGIRKNLGPDAQRKVDHMSIVAVTDQPALAEDLAPISGQKKISPSTHDAQLSSDRILRGLQYQLGPESVPEDYILVWLTDMGTVIQQIQQGGQMATPDQLRGLSNFNTHISALLKQMETNEDDKQKVKQYSDVLGKLMNYVKAFAQRLQEQQAQQNGNGTDPKDMVKVQMAKIQGAIKLQNMKESHATRTAQHQAQFELEQQRKDRELAADIRRKDAEANQELTVNAAKTAQELHHNRFKSLIEQRESNEDRN